MNEKPSIRPIQLSMFIYVDVVMSDDKISGGR